MKRIYKTKNEWSGYNKHSYYHNEYYQDGNEIIQFLCSRVKIFDGHENEWREGKKESNRWKIGDPLLPEWIRKYL